MFRYIILLLLLVNCETMATAFEPYLPKPDECVKEYQVLERLRLYRDYFWEISVNCKRADKCQAEDLLFDRVQGIISEATKKDTKCPITQVNLQNLQVHQDSRLYLVQLPENLQE